MDDQYLTIRAAVAIPALQALTSAVFVGAGVGGIAAAAGSLGLFQVSPLALGAIAGSVSGLASWRRSLSDWRLAMYGFDYGQEPEQVQVIPPPIRVELSSNNGRSMQFVDLPADVDQLVTLGAGIVQGLSFTESQWVGAGQPFTRGQFVRLRSEMIRRGLASWISENNTARGCRVTGKGQALFRHFASMSETPTLQVERTR